MTDTTPNNPSAAEATPQIPLLSSIQDFLFGAPLYAKYDTESAEESYFALFISPIAVDGQCPYCHRSATFHRAAGELKYGQLEFIKTKNVVYFQLSCTRDKDHQIDF